MTGPKRTKIKVQQDRMRIARLYLEGKMQVEIAAELGLSQGQISLDLKAIQKEWREVRFADIDQLKADQLAKIDTVEVEAWSAWRKSQEDRVISLAEKNTVGENSQSRTHMRKETQSGDPRFLERICWCIEQRVKIFGLAAPAKIAISDLDQLIEQELARIASSESETSTDLVC